MGPVSDLRERKETTMEASTGKNHRAVLSVPKVKNMRVECKNEDVEVNIINCTNDDVEVDIINCTNDDAEVDMLNCTNDDAEVDMLNCTNEDAEVDYINCANDNVEVDIINCTNYDDVALLETHSDDATASSSSFGDSFADVGTREYGSDNEVMSELREDDLPMRGFGGSGDLLPVRKKRVTSHWRKFVQPIMWHCKWVELQLRKLQSLSMKCDTELEKYNQTKHLKYGNFELEGRCAKLMPFFPDSQREKSMKRKTRKRHDEVDTEVYMSQHNLFSFFASCRSPSHGLRMDDDQANLATPSPDTNTGNKFRVPDELLYMDFRDDYSLEQLLWKIEVSQTQVCEMKNRLNIVMNENEERILSTENVILQESNNVLSTFPFKESDSPTNMAGPSPFADFASQLIRLNTSDDLIKIKPEVIDSGQGEGTHLQDANEPTELPPVASRKMSTDGILIYNRRAKKLKTDSGAVKVHPIGNLQPPQEEKSNSTAPLLVSEGSSQNEHPEPKLRSVTKLSSPKNKKKRAVRARRKSASSLWSRKN